MKSHFYKFSSLFFLLISIFSCQDDCTTFRAYTLYEPVYATTQALKDSVEYRDPTDLYQPGKIYFKDGFIFINEVGEGIHLIDNRDATRPQNIGFINIPGNFDLAAKGNYLYADSYVDLVIFDITDVGNIVEVKRIGGVFENYYLEWGMYDEVAGVLVDYQERYIEEKVEGDCGDYSGSGICFGCVNEEDRVLDANFSNGSGIGGSMARFTISDDYLYTLDSYKLRSFDITDVANPSEKSEIEVGWGMETIFPYENNIFLGARNGMHIYNIDNPALPSHVSTYEHIRSCDPVVVQGDYAYVTLRSGSSCEGFTNQLEVIDISNLSNPKLLHTYPMQNPHGLGIDGSCLFICEGEYGLKMYDAENVDQIGFSLIAHFDNIHALDVIPIDNILLLIGNDGFYQYNYDCNIGEISYLSAIPILSL